METVNAVGQIFPSGEVIELIRHEENLSLLHWNTAVATIGSTVEVDGKSYRPDSLDPTLFRAIQWPTGAMPCGSAASLVEELRAIFKEYSGLSEDFSCLLALYTLMTWLSDCVPCVPRLLLLGPPSRAVNQLTRLLTCVCRHALQLTSASARDLLGLPVLGLTIILHKDNITGRLQELLDTATTPGQFVPQHGHLLSALFPVILHCDKPPRGSHDVPSIEIPLVAAGEVALLNAETACQVAERFQNRLLAFRLQNVLLARTHVFDPKELTFPVRETVRALTACFPRDHELQAKVLALLRTDDAQSRCAGLPLMSLAWLRLFFFMFTSPRTNRTLAFCRRTGQNYASPE